MYMLQIRKVLNEILMRCWWLMCNDDAIGLEAWGSLGKCSCGQFLGIFGVELREKKLLFEFWEKGSILIDLWKLWIFFSEMTAFFVNFLEFFNVNFEGSDWNLCNLPKKWRNFNDFWLFSYKKRIYCRKVIKYNNS